MPNYAIDINTDTGDRELGVQYALAQHNAGVAERNAQLPEGAEPEPTLDAKQYLNKVLDSAIDSYASQALASKGDMVAEKFARADQATRDQVDLVLAQFSPAKLKVT